MRVADLRRNLERAQFQPNSAADHHAVCRIIPEQAGGVQWSRIIDLTSADSVPPECAEHTVHSKSMSADIADLHKWTPWQEMTGKIEFPQDWELPTITPDPRQRSE